MTTTPSPAPGLWKLFRIWTGIGLQSFGGGASTILLIQRTFITKYGWMTMEEFTHDWSLCLLTPGINLLALTVLIGRKLGGLWGMVISLAGLLLPSAFITCLLTAIFAQIRSLPAVQMILQGIIPATGAIMAVVGLNFALPILRKSLQAGVWDLMKNGALLLVCAVALIAFKVSPIAVIVAAVVLGALLFSPQPLPAPAREKEQVQ